MTTDTTPEAAFRYTVDMPQKTAVVLSAIAAKHDLTLAKLLIHGALALDRQETLAAENAALREQVKAERLANGHEKRLRLEAIALHQAAEAALRADNDRLRGELADANHTIVAYVAAQAVRHAEHCGLPNGHLVPHHYDILQKAGARMDSFTRAALDAKP
jgi:hypothetical protein